MRHLGEQPFHNLVNGQGLGHEPLVEEPEEAAIAGGRGRIRGRGHSGGCCEGIYDGVLVGDINPAGGAGPLWRSGLRVEF